MEGLIDIVNALGLDINTLVLTGIAISLWHLNSSHNRTVERLDNHEEKCENRESITDDRFDQLHQDLSEIKGYLRARKN